MHLCVFIHCSCVNSRTMLMKISSRWRKLTQMKRKENVEKYENLYRNTYYKSVSIALIRPSFFPTFSISLNCKNLKYCNAMQYFGIFCVSIQVLALLCADGNPATDQ